MKFFMTSFIFCLFSMSSAYSLTWEIRYDENSKPIFQGEWALEQPDSILSISQKIFQKHNIAYSLDQKFFSFINGIPWPWCFYVKEQVAFIPMIPDHLKHRLYRVNSKIWKPDQVISGKEHLIWCHCNNWPINLAEM